jgi:hypothetical protein
VARLDGNGQLDALFGTAGLQTIDVGPYDVAAAVAVQGDGKIVLAGFTNNYTFSATNFAVARVDGNGQLDVGFGTQGRETIDFDSSYD